MKITILTRRKEAEALVVGLSRALSELQSSRPPTVLDGVVQFRFDTTIHLLRILYNDALTVKRLLDEKETG